jgi:hypothetical protein
MKLPQFKLKMIIPVFIMVIFISSIFVVFSSGGVTTHTARLIVDFGQPSMFYDQEVALASNTSASRLLSAHAQSVELSNKQVTCIIDYCNTNATKWYFHTVKNDPIFGQQEVNSGIAPDDYIVQESDIIIFRYMDAQNSAANSVINNTVNNTRHNTANNVTNSTGNNVTNITTNSTS